MNIFCQAINEKKLLKFYYDGYIKIVEPFAYGYGTDGNLLLRAFQIDGFSRSGNPMGWKLFKVDKMLNVEILREHFSGYREGYNPYGDKQIPNIICKV